MKKRRLLRGITIVFAGIAIAVGLSQVVVFVQHQRAYVDGEPDPVHKIKMTLDILDDYVEGQPHAQSYDRDKTTDCSVSWRVQLADVSGHSRDGRRDSPPKFLRTNHLGRGPTCVMAIMDTGSRGVCLEHLLAQMEQTRGSHPPVPLLVYTLEPHAKWDSFVDVPKQDLGLIFKEGD